MLEKLEKAENRYEELTQKLTMPEVLGNSELFRNVAKEQASLEELVSCYREYKGVTEAVAEAQEILDEAVGDEELKILAKEQLTEEKEKQKVLNQKLKELLMPKDPMDDRNVVVEIRAGAGGEEAALFAAVLFRMYMKYAEASGFETSVMDENATELGGFKEIVFTVDGKGVFGKLKYESGVHRVQRVPTTESGGRIHTSTVTVAVIPEAEDVEFELDMNDVDVDTYRSGGAGGQHINKTESAIRLTHRPTGLVVTCQDQRSQIKNKDKAIKVLKSRLLDLYNGQKDAQLAEERRSMIGTGDRSEKIRTYNYPQSRLTDHRIDFTSYNLSGFVDGNLEELIEALITTDRARKLAEGGQNDDFF